MGIANPRDYLFRLLWPGRGIARFLPAKSEEASRFLWWQRIGKNCVSMMLFPQLLRS